MLRTVSHNVVIDPLHFEGYSDAFIRNCRDSHLAEVAWTRAQESSPQPYSRHYARGFKEGYVYFLDGGGDGATPLIPPRRY